MRKNMKRNAIFALLIAGVLLIVYYFNQKDDLDVQLFKTTELNSINFSESWELFEKELDIRVTAQR